MGEEFMLEDIHLFTGKRRREMVRPRASCRFQLSALWPESDQRTVRRVVSRHNGHGPSGQKCEQGDVMKTNGFRLNYLGPGNSYEKLVKVYGCFVQKSSLPYDWFDRPEKLNYLGLPDYLPWYSRLTGQLVLSLSDFQ